MTRPNAIVPCLWLDDAAEALAELYTRTFPEGRVLATARYPERGDNPAGKPPGSVLTVDFEVAGRRFTALNGGPLFRMNPSISFFVHVDEAAEADALYATLAEGGQVLMPLDAYPWSPRYAWVQDRFGVSWQVTTGRREPGGARIAPCLMFAGRQRGRAEEAMGFYAGVFPEGRVTSVERYAPGRGPEGMVVHGRLSLAGQELVAMDSHAEHDVPFGEGLSLQVMCEDQRAVDHYWARLAEGGEESVCGWLKDRFGLSWQVVPMGLERWLTSDDTEARDRAFAAMMQMKKPDIAALDAAFEGRG